MSKSRPHYKVGDRVVDITLSNENRAVVVQTVLDDRAEQSIKVHWDRDRGCMSEEEAITGNSLWPSSDFVYEDDFDADQ